MSIIYFFQHPRTAIRELIKDGFVWLPDPLYLKLIYWMGTGRILNLKNPKTFSEKLQWLKLYDHNPKYTDLVDKFKVKGIVSRLIGENYIIPTLGVWEKPEDINWNDLPNQFVLKTTHGGGSNGVIICRDKASFNIDAAIEKLRQSMKQDIYRKFREWPYKNVPRRIIAEQYINPTPDVTDLPDYKWYCFGGEPKYCQVIQSRSSNESIDFFDTEWNHQDFIGLNPSASHAAVLPLKPKNLDVQIAIAKELSKDTPFSRIDLYEIEENTYFGEVTFYPASGTGTFRPEKFNEILGNLIELPCENGGGNYQMVTRSFMVFHQTGSSGLQILLFQWGAKVLPGYKWEGYKNVC